MGHRDNGEPERRGATLARVVSVLKFGFLALGVLSLGDLAASAVAGGGVELGDLVA